MSPGKLAAQVAHASVGTILHPENNQAKIMSWFHEGFRKIVLKVESEKEILDLRDKCEVEGISYFVVTDFGITELNQNTITCIGIGPDLNKVIDKITGRIKLWR